MAISSLRKRPVVSYRFSLDTLGGNDVEPILATLLMRTLPPKIVRTATAYVSASHNTAYPSRQICLNNPMAREFLL
ncbi:hypothetical protein TNCV_1908831 [Trichonephila clavipes]|nr:hypothetical protein TNCV_1908831 [Trichonephila clavipes]